LFYLSGGSMNVVEIRPGPPFTVGPLRVLFARPDRVQEGSPIGGTFDIAPDDQRFPMVRNVTAGRHDPDGDAGDGAELLRGAESEGGEVTAEGAS
jgi:hypothetical protein